MKYLLHYIDYITDIDIYYEYHRRNGKVHFGPCPVRSGCEWRPVLPDVSNTEQAINENGTCVHRQGLWRQITTNPRFSGYLPSVKSSSFIEYYGRNEEPSDAEFFEGEGVSSDRSDLCMSAMMFCKWHTLSRAGHKLDKLHSETHVFTPNPSHPDLPDPGWFYCVDDMFVDVYKPSLS